MPDKADIIRGIFAAYLANERAAVAAAFTDDFRFSSPYDDRIDKTTYFERCWAGSDWIAEHEIEKILADGEEAYVTYRCVAKDGKSFRNTEFFRFAGDKVSGIEVYFGPAYENGKLVKQER
jgi:ketosteroid isomerase-like protein